MSEFLEATYDKFTFVVRTELRYNREDVWVRREGVQVMVGVTDFLQRRSGDVVSVGLPGPGTNLVAGDWCCTLDTIKTAVDITCPLDGWVIAVNGELEDRPELVNEDPYGRGWLLRLEPADPQTFESRLLDAQADFEYMVSRLEEEAGKLGH